MRAQIQIQSAILSSMLLVACGGSDLSSDVSGSSGFEPGPTVDGSPDGRTPGPTGTREPPNPAATVECDSPNEPMVLAASGPSPHLLTLDDDAVYWTTTSQTPESGTTEDVWTVSKAGGEAIRLASGLGELTAIAVHDGVVYGTERGTSAIFELTADATSPAVLLDASGPPADLAVNAGGVFWLDAAAGSVMRANLDGSGRSTLASGQRGPQQLALSDAHAYWLNDDTEAKMPAYALMRAPLDGGEAESIFGDQSYALGFVLDDERDPSHIYVGTWYQIIRVEPDGAGLEVLSDDASLISIPAVDSTRVYWATPSETSGASSVMSMLKDASDLAAVDDVSGPALLSADASGVYYFGRSGLARLCQ